MNRAALANWKSRHGLHGDGISASDDAKKEALQFGVRGETYACWHEPRLGCIFVRTAHYFLREWHIKECPLRFDVVAIDGVPGHPPVVRVHKATLSLQA